MPDFTMCGGTTLHTCSLCYRRTAKPSYRQSWFAEPPMDKNGECEHYMPPRVVNAQNTSEGK